MDQAVKIIIVEDDLIISEDLRLTLEEIGYQVLAIARNHDQAIELFDEEEPDLVILDISLGGEKSGIDVAQYIRKHFDIPFIFLTSHSDKNTVSQAAMTEPEGYLVKPFEEGDLYAAIEVALHKHNVKQRISAGLNPETKHFSDSIFIRNNKVFHRVKYDEMLYLEADKPYVHIVTNSRKLTDRGTLSDYEDLLAPARFIRVHRSFIINSNYLSKITQNEVSVGQFSIPIGKTYRAGLEKLMS